MKNISPAMSDRGIGIIGGGPVGLIALYECKARNIKATLYEKRMNIGGLWDMTDNSWAHRSTVFNTSSYVSSFQLDFPLTKFLERKYCKEYVDYATGEDYNEYLKEFVSHYELADMILLNTEIVDIITGDPGQQFTLKTINTQNKIEKSYSHDYVIIATGRQGYGITPKEPFLSNQLKMNIDNVWHTSYWDPLRVDSAVRHIVDRNPLKVLIVGSGASATDAIQDTITHSQRMGKYENLQILWAPTRDTKARNVWIFSRYPYKGYKALLPFDENLSRFFYLIPQWITRRKFKEFVEGVLLRSDNESIDFSRDRFSICETELIKKAFQDKILHVLKNPVEKIFQTESSQLAFETTSSEVAIVDAVIIGSGFIFCEPRINNEYILRNSCLYRHMIPIEESYHGRLAFIATTSVLGSVPQLAQMEARWLLYQWFHKKSNLTKTLEVLRLKSDNEVYDSKKKRWPGPLMDNLARDMGVHPRIWLNLFSLYYRQRHVALACLFGPWSIYQYATVDETDSERLKRENFLLVSTRNAYKKCRQSFRCVCFVSDMAYYMGLAAILSYSCMNCDLFRSIIRDMFHWY